MEIIQGAVANCQHTLRVTGGGNNARTTTTYIALFRVDGRPVEFRTSQPSAVADGDQVRVAGLPGGASGLTVLAMRNLTTGQVTNAGVWGYFFGAVITAAVGLLAGVFLAGSFGSLAAICVVAGAGLLAAYLVYRGILTIRAENRVNR